MAVFPNFIGGSYADASLPISAQRCINWYPETPNYTGAVTELVAKPSAGYIEAFVIDDEDLPDGSFTRAMYTTSKGLGTNPELGGSLIVVVGPRIYWVKKNDEGEWAYEQVGSDISNLTTTVDMVDDGEGLIIVDGVSMYRLNLITLEFIEIAHDDIQPTHVAYIDSYTVVIGTTLVNETPRNYFYFSYPGDNSQWEAADRQAASKSADPILALVANDNYLYTFGPNSYEQFVVSGDYRRPFSIAYSSSGTVGIYAPDSLVKMGNQILFLGTAITGQVAAYMGVGTSMTKVSKQPLETEWAKNTTSDCTTWADSYSGHDFVYFNFDSLDKTYCYDLGEDRWSERASRDETTDTFHRWDLNYVAHRYGETLCGDRFSNTFYLVGAQYLTENGKNILRVLGTSHVTGQMKMAMYNSVTIDMETGSGISAEDTAGRFMDAPVLMYRYSHDRGRTWSSEQRISLGATGEYQDVAVLQRLGAARSLTIELKMSDPCSTAILTAYVDAIFNKRRR